MFLPDEPQKKTDGFFWSGDFQVIFFVSLVGILDFPKDASMNEVHAAYKKRALDSHPDKPGG